jgi:hypothetical protein
VLSPSEAADLKSLAGVLFPSPGDGMRYISEILLF